MMFFEIVTSLFLLAIILELGWIIYKDVKVSAQSDASLSAAQEALKQAQELWRDDLKALADQLSRATEVPDALPPASPDPPLNPIEDNEDELLVSLQSLSSSIAALQQSIVVQSSNKAGDRLAAFVEKFEPAVWKLNSSVGLAVDQIIKERQKFLDALSSQSRVQQTELRGLTNALVDALKRSMRAAPDGTAPNVADRALTSTVPAAEDGLPASWSPSTTAPQPATPSKTVEAAPRIAEEAMTETEPTVALARSARTGQTRTGGSRQAETAGSQPSETARRKNSHFESLHKWVASNLDRIMSRSLNQWNKPEELLCDAPANLKFTARILDPDSKLVLVGTDDSSQFLALALPGGHIDPSYQEWFSLPKGVGKQVERTRTVAIVDTSETGYQVLSRGVIE